ncbi:MAG: metallophosphoesterase [Solobacterium sp.]|nr:metallophosphoesterase [Solobacterium sp.]
MKIFYKLMLVISLIIALLGFGVFAAYNIFPSQFTIRYENLTAEAIPAQMEDIKILFFSDLEYGTFMNSSRLLRLVDAINASAPDIVIFGGDLYDESAYVTTETTAVISDAFRKIDAPLGKFAVYGDNDHESDHTLSMVRQALVNADFEVLNNTSVSIHNRSSKGIFLVGLDSEYKGSIDMESAYEAVSGDAYVITVCHTPDTADRVPADLTDYFLAGHSHGGQAWFGFQVFYSPPFARKYLRGKHIINDAFTLDITSGTGTTGEDVRFFTNAEAVVYRLHNAR